MKAAFDLDGTLDRPGIAKLANALLNAGHRVYIMTSHFKEGGEWQSPMSKMEKLRRVGVPFEYTTGPLGKTIFYGEAQRAELIILEAVDVSFSLDYRLRDLGLRKGELCERLGVDLIVDDSPAFAEVFRLMNGHTNFLQVR